LPVVRKAESNNYSTPSDTDSWQENSRSNLAAYNDHDRLAKHVCDEEAKIDEVVPISSIHAKVFEHASNGGIRDILPVHEGDAVHRTERWNQAPINAMSKFRYELGVERIRGRRRRGKSLLDMLDVVHGLILGISARHVERTKLPSNFLNEREREQGQEIVGSSQVSDARGTGGPIP
jgi:hypothetical protein